MVHIYGHSWPIRYGKEGESKEILVYSNCPEVELFVNGVSQGKRKRNSQDFPAAGLHWNVQLKEGNNQIQALARKGKDEWKDEINQEYQIKQWTSPSKLRLSIYQPENDEKSYLLAELLDENNIRCLDSNLFIRFGSTHPNGLITNQGTATGSQRIQAANGRALIQLNPQFKNQFIASAYTEIDNIQEAFLLIPLRE